MTQWEYSESGVTLRDQFAMAALQAMPSWIQHPEGAWTGIAQLCYIFADAMMEARGANKGKDKQ